MCRSSENIANTLSYKIFAGESKPFRKLLIYKTKAFAAVNVRNQRGYGIGNKAAAGFRSI